MGLPRRRSCLSGCGGGRVPTASRLPLAQAIRRGRSLDHRLFPRRHDRHHLVVVQHLGPSSSASRSSSRAGPAPAPVIATESVVRAAADGYTLLFVGAPNAIMPRSRRSLISTSPRHRTGRRHRPRAERHGGAPVGSRRDGPGVHRLRQGNPGRINMASSASALAASRRRAVPHDGRASTSSTAPIAAPAGDDRPASGQVQLYFVDHAELLGHIRVSAARSAWKASASPSCRTPRPSPSSCRASRRAPGTGSARRATRRRRSSTPQPRDQRGARRAEDQGAARRARLHGDPRLAGLFHPDDRRRDRKMGQGGDLRGPEAGVMASAFAKSCLTGR